MELTLDAVRAGLLALLLALAVASDLHSRRIPNALTFSGCLLALALAALAAGPGGLADAGGGLLLAFALTLPLWLVGWFGAGDVKLLAAVGAFTGSSLVLPVLGATAIAGAVLALLALAARGLLARTGERMTATLGLSVAARRWVYVAPDAQEQAVRLPYAVAIAAGTLAALVIFGG